MQAARPTQNRPSITSMVSDRQATHGPVSLSPELLQFVGGGKGPAPAPPTPMAPRNGW